MKKKGISIILALAVMFVFIPVNTGVSAAAKNPGSGMQELAKSFQAQSGDPYDFTEKGEQFKAVYPDRLDLRDVNGKCYVTPVKCQAPFGTCWGFAAIGAAETSILGNEELNKDESGEELYSTSPAQVGSTDGKDADGKEILNLSEKHLANFVVKPLDDPDNPQNGEGTYMNDGLTVTDGLNNGGFPLLATNTFSSGMGPVLESRDASLIYQGGRKLADGTLDYSNPTVVRGWVNGKHIKLTFSDKDDWSVDESWRFKQNYVLQESYMLPTPAQITEGAEGGHEKYTYNPDGTYAIKDQLNKKRAVEIGFSCMAVSYGDTGTFHVFNEDNWSYYNPDISGPNHAVLIVGYDDNYPKENFGDPNDPDRPLPEGDGAWLVKNSWGSEEEVFPNVNEGNWGLLEGQDKPPYKATSDVNTGYFWLSYYDQTIENPEALAFDKAVSKDGYIIDEHDFMPVMEMSTGTATNEVKMCNVFTAEYNEELTDISCQTATPGTAVTYQVYLLSVNSLNPEQGLLVAEGEETFQYGGYHKISVNPLYMDKIQIAKGQQYSVIITQKTPEGTYSMNVPVGMSKDDADEYGTTYQKGIINEKESYVYVDGQWLDYSSADVRTQLFGADAFEGDEYDNFPIKGYCVKSEGQSDLEFDIFPSSEEQGLCTFEGSVHDTTFRCMLIGNTDLPEGSTIEWSLGPGTEELVDLKVEDPEGAPDLATVTAKKAGKGTLLAKIDGIGIGVVTLDVTDLKTNPPFVEEGDEVTYTGKALTPRAIVNGYPLRTDYGDEGELVNGEDYTIEYKNNIKCGKAILHAVMLKENIEQPADGFFIIVPAKAVVKKLAASGKTLKVTAKNQKKSGLTGYQIAYKAKGTKKWKTTTSKKNVKTIKKLKSGKTYQVKVRGFVKVDNKNHYGPWSKVKTAGK